MRHEATVQSSADSHLHSPRIYRINILPGSAPPPQISSSKFKHLFSTWIHPPNMASPPSTGKPSDGQYTDSEGGTMVDGLTPRDMGVVNETGHVQELERNFSLLSVCSVGIVTGNTWAALGGSIAVAI